MKITNTFKSIVAAIGFCSLLPVESHAQLSNPYTVYNNLTCDVGIAFKLRDGLTCDMVCWGTYIIPAGGSINITCGNPMPNTDDIYIAVSWVDDPNCRASQMQMATPYATCDVGASLQPVTPSCGACTNVTLDASSGSARIY